MLDNESAVEGSNDAAQTESIPSQTTPVESQNANPVSDSVHDNQSDSATEKNATEDAADTQPIPVEATEEQTEEAPEWFMKDKFKSTEEQAKAYNELQKKMGKYWGPPKDDYSIDGIEGVSKDDPLIGNLIPSLKDIGLSQEGVTQLIKGYQDANIKMMKTLEDELKHELTVKDASTYQACDKWMKENLTKEEQELVQNNWMMTAADFKLFNQIRLMAGASTNVPSSSEGDVVRFESSKSVENDKIKYRKEINQKLRVPDKNYENELAQRFRDARTRELRNKA